MMKRNWMVLGTMFASTAVMAHPGEHADFHAWEAFVHFVSNPDHVGILVGVALLVAAALVWSTARGR